MYLGKKLTSLSLGSSSPPTTNLIIWRLLLPPSPSEPYSFLVYTRAFPYSSGDHPIVTFNSSLTVCDLSWLDEKQTTWTWLVTTLAKESLSSIPSHVMQFIKLPSKTTKLIDRIQKKFIWGTTRNMKKIHLVGWERVTTPKCHGGLGLQKVECKNRAFHVVLSWRIFHNTSSILGKSTHFQALYLEPYPKKFKSSIWQCIEPYPKKSKSSIWQCILRGWDTQAGQQVGH